MVRGLLSGQGVGSQVCSDPSRPSFVAMLRCSMLAVAVLGAAVVTRQVSIRDASSGTARPADGASNQAQSLRGAAAGRRHVLDVGFAPADARMIHV
jgi:hypothetical protein